MSGLYTNIILMTTIFLYSSFYDQVRHNPIYIQADELEDAIDSNIEMFQYPTHQYPLTYEEQRGARVKELKSHYEQQDLSSDEGSNEYAIVRGLPEDDSDDEIEPLPRGSQHYAQQGDEGNNEYTIVRGLVDDEIEPVSIEPRGSQQDSNIYDSISKDTI